MMGRRGVAVYSSPLVYRSKTIQVPGFGSHTFLNGEEKGIDVRLALDALDAAHRNRLDVALIFSQDQDLSELASLVRLVAGFQNRWIKIACRGNWCHSVRKARERRKRLELGNLSSQPCGLTNPARQSLASSRKRVLRGGGATLPAKRRQRVPMPCDRAPKSFLREPPLLTQAGAASRRRNGLACIGPTGVQEQGVGTRGSLGNLRDPAVSVVTAGWGPGLPTPG